MPDEFDDLPDPTPEELAEIERLGREEPLPADQARRLYTRIFQKVSPGATKGEVTNLVDTVMTFHLRERTAEIKPPRNGSGEG